MQDDLKSTSFNYSGGGYDFDFVNTPPDRLVCKICCFPCCKAQQSECCGNVFCKSDVDQYEATTTMRPLACPVCRNEEFVTQPNLATDHEIQQLIVYCPNKEITGCNWTGKIKDIEKHYSHGRECETECEKCKAVVKHKLMPSHLDDCPCYCLYCDSTADREVISSKHKEKCHKFPLTCPNNCGVDNIPQGDMDEHKKVCPLEMIQCEFHGVGCEAIISREDAESHVKENLMMHLHLTQIKLTVTNKELEECNAKYMNTTTEVNKSLSALQERLEALEDLFENNQSKDKNRLLNLLQSKLCADAETQTCTDTDVSKFRRLETSRQTLTFSKSLFILPVITVAISIALIYTITSIRPYYIHGSPHLPTINEYHKNVSVVLYELIDKSTMSWPIKLYHWTSITTIAPVVIKLSSFSRRKNEVSYSKPFFAFKNGYQLRLKYYPYGFTEKGIQGHYMSVYLHLVKGPYDEMLEENGHFPLKGKVTVELLNPREDVDHVIFELMLDTYNCNSNWIERITEVPTNPQGCGFPRFISLKEYDFESNYHCPRGSKSICHYLYDDALYFRVKIENT